MRARAPRASAPAAWRFCGRTRAAGWAAEGGGGNRNFSGATLASQLRLVGFPAGHQLCPPRWARTPAAPARTTTTSLASEQKICILRKPNGQSVHVGGKCVHQMATAHGGSVGRTDLAASRGRPTEWRAKLTCTRGINTDSTTPWERGQNVTSETAEKGRKPHSVLHQHRNRHWTNTPRDRSDRRRHFRARFKIAVAHHAVATKIPRFCQHKTGRM
jgi:hypothetical protein